MSARFRPERHSGSGLRQRSIAAAKEGARESWVPQGQIYVRADHAIDDFLQSPLCPCAVYGTALLPTVERSLSTPAVL